MPSPMRALMWFRSDLRIDDQPALHAAACQSQRGVLAVYAICPDQLRRHDMAPVKVDFILRNLKALSQSLVQRNIAMKIVVADTYDRVGGALLKLARAHQCDALFMNREYEVNERRRDDSVTEAFVRAGLSVHQCTDQCLFEPGDLRTTEDRFYTVFTPFKRAWSRELIADPARAVPLSSPKSQAEMISTPDEIPSQVPGFETGLNTSAIWPAGEQAAQGRLDGFIRDRVCRYNDDRDIASIEGTSALSPYLVSGVISLRQCLYEATGRSVAGIDVESPGPRQWITEFAWREFYKHILVGFPRVSMHRAFRMKTERIEWDDDDELFGAWCIGRTGYPIVDAGMRQLTQTGWMHNRLRMITAMFLSKNLFLDWRRGERFFMRRLIDGDLSANNGGWQWAASTGTDAAPYFRVFNPCLQSKKCDPDGSFICRFVPELDGVDTPALHDPSNISPLLRASVEYPEPIVEHRETRARAIEAFKALN